MVFAILEESELTLPDDAIEAIIDKVEKSHFISMLVILSISV